MLSRGRWLSVLLLLVGAFGSCSSASRDVRGRDHGTILPAMRIAIDLRGRPSDGVDGADGEYRSSRPITDIELDVSGADGDSTSSGVRVGEYRMIEGGASLRFGRVVRDKVAFLGLVGIGAHRLELSDRSALPFVDDKQTELGLRVGAQLRFLVSEWLAIHSRLTAFVQPFDMVSTQLELGFAVRADDLDLLFGYRQWRFNEESSGLHNVDEVDLRVDGLFLGLELRF